MITLTVNGDTYAGWIDLTVSRALDQLAHSFELTCTDHWAEADAPRPIRLGDQCTVDLDGAIIITGWVDALAFDATAEGATVRISGRSLTGDLVDCAAIHKTGQWRNSTALGIIEDICAPFGIPVEADALVAADTALVIRFDLEDGETAFGAIDRLARLRAMLPTSTPKGALRFTRVSRTSGESIKTLDAANAIRRSVQQNTQDRHSEYHLNSQYARTNATDRARDAATAKIVIYDENVTRYRPLIVHAEHGVTAVEMRDLAIWTRNTRAAQAERVIFELPGPLAWEPGQLVYVRDQALGVDDVLVLASIMMRESAHSSITELQLARIEAFTAEPLPRKDLIHKLRASAAPFFGAGDRDGIGQ